MIKTLLGILSISGNDFCVKCTFLFNFQIKPEHLTDKGVEEGNTIKHWARKGFSQIRCSQVRWMQFCGHKRENHIRKGK